MIRDSELKMDMSMGYNIDGYSFGGIFCSESFDSEYKGASAIGLARELYPPVSLFIRRRN
jgi:hypothetical protein